MLVSRLQALLHEGRLKILRELDEAETLIRELQDFRMEFTAAGHMTFNARSGKHDDLVLALAIAVWRAHRRRQRGMGIPRSDAAAGYGLDGKRAALLHRRRSGTIPRPHSHHGGAPG